VAEVLLHAEDLGKTYGTSVKTVALQSVSFDLQSGEFASIIGESGSGKSTLLNLIGLLDTPTTGRVVLNGHDTAAANRKQRAAMRNDFIGFVFQFHYLLPEFSVLENVLMPGRIAGVGAADLRPRAEEVLALLGLDGLENKGANDLSGGQKQRVAIARALVNEPVLVIADEPTGNLDPDLSLDIMNLFREINATGTTVLVATHDRELIRHVGRRAIMLDHGHVAESS
jgi:lipoprotein-releasing system ATP-binding protein